MSLIDEVLAIELVSPRVKYPVIVSNKKVDFVVFHPIEPLLYVRLNGSWIKLKVEAIP